MKQLSTVVSKVALINFPLVLIFAMLVLLYFFPSLGAAFLPKLDHIRDLSQLPLAGVGHFQGVVTYADSAAKRFWVQDDSGAIAIEQDPRIYGLHGGETVTIEGRKTHPYNSLVGYSSVGLTHVTISLARTQGKLPSPVSVSLRAFPEKDTIGVRIQLSGIVHRVMRDSFNRTQIALGESGQQITATISDATSDVSEWVDAKVRLVGVSESTYDEKGRFQNRHIWVQNSNDVQIEQAAPKDVALYSIRRLYRNFKSISGHRIQLRGRVAARISAQSLLLEDRWGAIVCDLDESNNFAIGTPVIITGFPFVDGFRINLVHSFAKQSALSPVESDQNENPRVLTTVAAVRGLDEQQASAALPTRVTGVITYNDPDWRHLFFQDSTGGIYVKYSGARVPLAQGQQVTLIGITNPGDYAPVIVAPRFIISGKTAMPRPIQVKEKNALFGTLDSQFVEVEGVIHPLEENEEPGHVTFELYSPFGQIHVYTNPTFAGKERLARLVDATVLVRGVFGTVFNSRRQLVGYQLSISSINDIKVLEVRPSDPFKEASIQINHLLSYSPHADSSHRIKVNGVVTMLSKGFFYLQDHTGGVEVQGDTSPLRVADEVEAVGYATAGGGYSPVLTDATIRVVRHNVPVVPAIVTAESSLEGQFDSQLVTIDGRLIGFFDSPMGKELILQSGVRTFTAQLSSLDFRELMPQLREDEGLRLTGVCAVQVNPSKLYLLLAQEPVGFSLLLRSPRDVDVIRPAPWWTPQYNLFVLGILFLGMIVTFIWGARLRKRLKTQVLALQNASDKAKAILDLARAMRHVTVSKDFSRNVTVGKDYAIGQLGIAFNKMLGELKLREAAKQKAEEKLQHQALTDELTGLPNRRLLSDRLIQTLALAKREQNVIGVLYIDLDGFKMVNDSLGHRVGDLLLCQVTERLKSRIRLSDTLARLGGDEFTIILTKLNCKEDAENVGRGLLDVLIKPFVVENQEITISASIGISIYPEDSSDEIDLLQHADSAMYAAKRNGKNQLVYFTPELGSLVRERLSLENQLRGALARDEITIHYQPEFDISSGQLIRFEALARWIHPTLGTIPPTKFIPIAEESGLIIPFGAYIMERACVEAAHWQTIALVPIQIAVNVSSLQFMRESFVQEVSDVLGHSNLNPALLQIELTESVMLSGAEKAAETMKGLRALGVSIAIDDFGTGYSCLSYLPKLPFSALKIDRSFVRELESRPETRAMVQSLITLAHNLDMQVIVEGIETPEQLAMIRSFGANAVQGYLLGRPTADPVNLLSQNNPTIGVEKIKVTLPASVLKTDS